jgi:hypothetical protein
MSGRGGSLTNAVAVARPVLQDVDVQVLDMRRIGPWAEYRCKPPACGWLQRVVNHLRRDAAVLLLPDIPRRGGKKNASQDGQVVSIASFTI